MSVRFLILNFVLILTFFPVERTALGSDGADVTLCKLNEEIYFSCPLSDGRIVSICAFENRNDLPPYKKKSGWYFLYC